MTFTKSRVRIFEAGGNACSQCGRVLAIPDYFGVYENSVFHVKGYRCPKCENEYKDRTPLKVVRYNRQTEIWEMVNRDDEIPLIQRWDPMLIGITSKGGSGGGAL
jgi:hypothetical protein